MRVHLELHIGLVEHRCPPDDPVHLGLGKLPHVVGNLGLSPLTSTFTLGPPWPIARFVGCARLTWSLAPHPPAEEMMAGHWRPRPPVALSGVRSAGPATPVTATSLLLRRTPNGATNGQDLPLSRTMLSNQELPYVGRFACDWLRLATTDPDATHTTMLRPSRRERLPPGDKSSPRRLRRRSRGIGASSGRPRPYAVSSGTRRACKGRRRADRGTPPGPR